MPALDAGITVTRSLVTRALIQTQAAPNAHTIHQPNP